MLSDHAIRCATERFRLAAPPEAASRPNGLQVVLDASLSMSSGDGSKEQIARELAIVLLRLSETAVIPGQLCAVRGVGRNRTITAVDADRVVHIPFDGDSPVPMALDDDTLGPAAAVRVVISDFLWPGDPAPFVQAASARANRLWFVQVLDDWELNPDPAGPVILSDIETDETLEIVLDGSATESYRVLLGELCQALDRACRSVGASLTTVSAAIGLEKLCSDWLVPAGLLVYDGTGSAKPRMTQMSADRAEATGS